MQTTSSLARRPPSLARSPFRAGVEGAAIVAAAAGGKRVGGANSGNKSGKNPKDQQRPPPEIPGWGRSSSNTTTTTAPAQKKTTPHGALHRAERVAQRRAERSLEAATAAAENGSHAPSSSSSSSSHLTPYLPVALEYVAARSSGRDGSEVFRDDEASDGNRRSRSRSRSPAGASPSPLSRGARRSAERSLLEHHTASFGAALDAEFEEEWAEAEARLASWPRERLEREGLALFGLSAAADGALLSDGVVRLVRPAVERAAPSRYNNRQQQQQQQQQQRRQFFPPTEEWESLPYHAFSAGDVVLLTRTGEQQGRANDSKNDNNDRQRGRDRQRRRPPSLNLSRSRSRSPAAAALASLAADGVEAVVVETAARWLRVALPQQASGAVSGGGWRVDLFANAASHERSVTALARFAAPAVSPGGAGSSASSSSRGRGRRAVPGAPAALLGSSLDAQRAAQLSGSDSSDGRPPTVEEDAGWRALWRALSGAVPIGGSAEAAAALPPPWLRVVAPPPSSGGGKRAPPALPGPQKQALQQAARARLAAGKAAAQEAAARGELNPSQRAAVEAALGRTLTLWQGPPGTGKTATLVRLVATLLAALPPRAQLLVTAASNVAVDNIVSGLLEMMGDEGPDDRGYGGGGGGAAAAGVVRKRRSGGGGGGEGEEGGDAATPISTTTTPWIVRVGQPAKMDPALRAMSLDAVVAETPLGKRAVSLRAQAAKGGGGGANGSSSSSSSSAPATSGSQRAGLWAAAAQAEQLAAQAVLDRARVVAATCVGAGEPRLEGRRFAVVLLDEATQATEPAALVALAGRAASAVLVGDQAQLPPTVRSPLALDLGLGDSLFERLLRMGVGCSLLDIQYRMHPAIAEFPSRAFYGGRLGSAPRPEDRPPVAGLNWPRPEVPVVFLQVDGPSERRASMMDGDVGGVEEGDDEEEGGVEGEEEAAATGGHGGRKVASSSSSSSSYSYENRAEAAVVLAALQAALKQRQGDEDEDGAGSAASSTAATVAPVPLRGAGEACVISPYAGQVRLVSAALQAVNNNNEQPLQQPQVEVRSVDGFQGREKELVVFSAVRSNAKGRVGFLSDARRLNVALTRARRGLVVVGDARTLARGDATWRAWLEWAKEQGVLLEKAEEVARFVGRGGGA